MKTDVKEEVKETVPETSTEKVVAKEVGDVAIKEEKKEVMFSDHGNRFGVSQLCVTHSNFRHSGHMILKIFDQKNSNFQGNRCATLIFHRKGHVV